MLKMAMCRVMDRVTVVDTINLWRRDTETLPGRSRGGKLRRKKVK